MARRLFNGRAFSENGWPYVDEESCTWITVLGTDPPVRLQIQNGPPLIILGAFAADYHAHVEHLRDGDSGCWTPGNSVPTSNHPGGTAEDLNWDGPDGHTFRYGIPEERAYPGAEAGHVRELLGFYEDTVFCGGFWSIRDWMHFQMGGETYDTRNDRPTQKTLDFINRKIRPDGFSTFHRTPGPLAPPPPLSRADRYALTIITVGQRLGITPRGCKIAISVALVESELTMYANVNVPESLAKNPDGSEKYPHEKVGSDHDSTGLFQQRQAWGPLSCTMNAACSAGLFYNGGNAGQRGLTDFDYNNTANSPGVYAQRVQVSAFPDRYDQRYGEAERIYNRLLALPLQPGDDWLNMPSNQEKLDAIYNALFQPMPPENIYRSAEDETQGVNLIDSIQSILSMVYEGVVERLALEVQERASIEKVVRVARGEGPEVRPWAVERANLIWQKGRSGAATVARVAVPMPTPIAMPSPALVDYVPEVIQPEVLPAVREPAAAEGHTAEDLIAQVDRLNMFKRAFDQSFAALTAEEEPGTGEHSK